MNLEGNITSKQALKGVLAIRQGIDGKDGQNGKDGYTPQKGIDYFDGEKGEKGDTPDLSEYVKNDYYATTERLGLIKANPSGGLHIDKGGLSYLERANDGEIKGRLQYFKPIVPRNMDLAVKECLANSYITWTDEEKQKSRELLDTSSAIKTKASGTTILTTDSAKVKPKNIKLFGKGKQRQYEGNQLANFNDIVGTTNGYAFVREFNLLANTEMTMHMELDNEFSGALVNFVNDAGDTIYTTGIGTDVTTFSLTQEQVDAITQINLFIYDSLAGSKVKYIMLNEGNTKKPYEPFVGNEPSPNMNYPQKAEFLGEGGSIVGKVLGKNFADTSKLKHWGGNDVVEKIDNGFYLKPINEENRVVVIGCDMRKGNKYTLSYDIESLGSESANDINYYLTGVDNTQIYNALISFQPLVFAPQMDIKEIAIYTSVHPNAILKITNVQVELGDTTTSYETYTEQPFTFLTPNGLRGIPLGQTIPDAIKNSPIHMSGVYWDGEQYQIADTENENGKDVQRIWKGVANRPIQFENSVGEQRFSLWLPNFFDSPTNTNKWLLSNAPALSNIAKWSSWANGDNHTFSLMSDGLWYRDNEHNLEELNAIFSELGTDIEVYGVLAEPIITETDSQHDVVMNYPNTTIINDAGAYMEVEYVADTKCYIDNKFKELEANITSAIAQLL